MNDKMVLSCLKLKQNSFKSLKPDVFIFTTKTFWMFKTVRENEFRKDSKAKRGNCFNRGNIVLIIFWYNIKSETMAKLNVYHLFVIASALICSRPQKTEERRKEKEHTFGSDLYLVTEQLAVFIKA